MRFALFGILNAIYVYILAISNHSEKRWKRQYSESRFHISNIPFTEDENHWFLYHSVNVIIYGFAHSDYSKRLLLYLKLVKVIGL